MQTTFLLNGETVTAETSPTTTLLDWLRETQGLTGTKEGCNEGDCGACTVAVASREGGVPIQRAHNACILFLPQLEGKSVTTVEGLADGDTLHAVQQAMVETHASQCGFCTPGIVMSLYVAQAAGREDWEDVLAGNLCRCTGYAPILRAAQKLEPARATPLLPTAPAAAPPEALPTSLDAFAAWYETHPEATLIAGATDIGLWVTKGLQELQAPVFLHRLSALQTIEDSPQGTRIGAGTTIAALRHWAETEQTGFAEMLRRFGSAQVRAAATLGGNIANGSPIGDCPPPLIALGARLTLRKGSARREIPLEDFFLAYGKQDRRKGEFVESVFIPKTPGVLRVHKISKRFDQDISALCGAFYIDTEMGRVRTARIAFGGMAATPKRAHAVEKVLTGRAWSKESIAAAIPAIAEDFAPISDMRASAAYRLKAAENMLIRSFLEMETRAATRLAAGDPA